ncbi:GrpB family protein [Paenibacillus glacialis]|uniref:GrpB family protein n=1 Tax=Paenibacillus glacialis TaxID=494026 RepID=UPI001FE0A4C4|nr:GrpB family protein [Paenibacillus glacialis]
MSRPLLSFRDYLCHNPEVSKDYVELKSELAKKCSNGIERYGDGKDDFVKRVEKQALICHWTR